MSALKSSYKAVPLCRALFRQIANKRSLDRVTTPVPNNRLVFSALIFGGTTSTSAREMSCSREVEALKAKARSQPRQMTDDEWRLILTPEEYHVTRMKGTERPFSCARVNDNHQKGQYNCICCGVPLFTSETKFEAGCGWPSFSDTLKKTQDGWWFWRGRQRCWGGWQQFRDEAGGGQMSEMRRSPGSRFQRRPATDRTQVLHQRYRNYIRQWQAVTLSPFIKTCIFRVILLYIYLLYSSFIYNCSWLHILYTDIWIVSLWQ